MSSENETTGAAKFSDGSSPATGTPEAASRDQILARLCRAPAPRPTPPPSYVSFRRVGNMGVTSGVLSTQQGPVERVADGQKAAGEAICTLLKWLSEDLGGLDKVKLLVRLEGYVAAGERFIDHSIVLNAASEMLLTIFGQEAGAHTRIAVGSPSLPRRAAVELALWIEV